MDAGKGSLADLICAEARVGEISGVIVVHYAEVATLAEPEIRSEYTIEPLYTTRLVDPVRLPCELNRSSRYSFPLLVMIRPLRYPLLISTDPGSLAEDGTLDLELSLLRGGRDGRRGGVEPL